MAHILSRRFAAFALVAPALMLASPAAEAGVGDLLVAPTRIVLDGRRGAEVILNNIGDDVATYRVTAELRRMTPDGNLVDVTEPNAGEKVAQEMLLYAPRRITLPPNQPKPSVCRRGRRKACPTANIGCTCCSGRCHRRGRRSRRRKSTESPSSCARFTVSPSR
jgi:hypothetical protein